MTALKRVEGFDLSVARPASPIERIAATAIITIIVIGVFFPPESYFAPQDYSIEAQSAEGRGGFTLGRLGYAVTLGWLAVVCIAHRNEMIGAFRRSWLPLLFAGWTLASAAWAPEFSTSANRSLRLVILVAFALYFVRCFDERERLAILTHSMAAAVAASVFAVVVMPSYGMSMLQGYSDALRGAFGHKNTLGATMAAGVFIGYYALIQKATSRSIALFVLIGCFFLTVASRSATSILAMLVTWPIVYWFAWMRTMERPIDRILLLWSGGLFFALVAWVLTDDSLIFEILGRSSTLTGRTEVWGLSIWAADLNPWLGQGHTFWSVPSPVRTEIWRLLSWAPPHAHNTLIDLWLQLGLVGAGLAILIFAVILVRGVGIVLAGAPGASILWFVLFVQLLIRSLSETTIIDPSITGAFWLTAVYAVFSELSLLKRLHRKRLNGRPAGRAAA